MARAIIATGKPLDMLDHPLWKFAFRTIRPALKLPDRRKISTVLLDFEYEETKSDVERQIETSDNLSLQCDGWSNIRNESIVNIVVSTPQPFFIKSIDTKANAHTSEYIAEIMLESIEQYGSQKFAGVVTDNAKNMRKAGEIVALTHKHIIPYGCIAHTIQLIFGDVLKIKTIDAIISQVIA